MIHRQARHPSENQHVHACHTYSSQATDSNPTTDSKRAADLCYTSCECSVPRAKAPSPVPSVVIPNRSAAGVSPPPVAPTAPVVSPVQPPSGVSPTTPGAPTAAAPVGFDSQPNMCCHRSMRRLLTYAQRNLSRMLLFRKVLCLPRLRWTARRLLPRRRRHLFGLPQQCCAFGRCDSSVGGASSTAVGTCYTASPAQARCCHSRPS